MRRTDDDRFGTPYLGPESFQPEDADLFFGREREAEQLIAMILSARCTLLHARSGAGKTSLLNAVVIPRLEARSHVPVRILPGDDPIEAVRVATLHYLLPPPQAEAEALERAREALGLAAGDTLRELLRSYDRLGEDESRKHRSSQEIRRRLVAPVEIDSTLPGLALPISGLVMPWLCRVLRSSVEVATFAAHLATVSPGHLGESTSIAELAERLADPSFETSYARLLDMLYLPIPGLRPFFANLFAVYAHAFEQQSRWRRLGLILVLDQFEELFTRFVDPGRTVGKTRAGQPDWRLRRQFFRDLEELYAEPAAGAPDSDAAGPDGEAAARAALLPIRFVVSMRNEYVAQLDPIRRFVPDLARSTFHLDLLGTVDAEAAIRKPAERYGVRYSQECVARIVEQLAHEERYVEPPYVQIVCSRLWRNRGAALATGAAEGEISVGDFEQLGEMQGILDRFFNEFLAGLGATEERLEALEMLERLITTADTRNIVAQDELLTAPFRRPELRRDLLSRLQNGNVVRIERRMGTHFVEITHEFLIAPIRKEIRQINRSTGYRLFVDALEALGRLRQSAELRVERRKLLDAATLEQLEGQEGRLRWGYLGTEAMLRSTILAGRGREALRRWVERYRGSKAPWDVEKLLRQVGDRGQRTLARDELDMVEAAVAAGHVEPGKLEPQQVQLVLRSLLAHGGDADREQIMAWTREAMRHGS